MADVGEAEAHEGYRQAVKRASDAQGRLSRERRTPEGGRRPGLRPAPCAPLAVPGLETTRLHLADDVLTLWSATQLETHDPDAPIPFWAFAWGGGLAIGRYLREHPEVVAGRRVFDLAAGSGICAIAAMQAGAAAAAAADVDPFAIAAIRLNARANGCRVATIGRDVLDEAPPDAEVILAGDCWYDAELARRVLPWLRASP